MLTPKQLQEIAERMQPVLDELNNWIIRDIVKRVVARLEKFHQFEITTTSQWQAQVMIDAGGHLEDLQREIVSYTRRSNAKVRRIFQEAGLEAYETDAETMRQAGVDVPSLRQSPRIQKILEDTYQRTLGELKNYTRTTAVKSQQELIKALDLAHIKVMSGATSYNEAVRETIMDLSEHQAQVVYPTGHVDTLEVAVLRAVRTGTAQASGNMTMGLMDQYKWDIVLTSAHLGARYGDGGENPGNHSWWQGRFFSVSGKDERFPDFYECTGYGTGEGLCGWNCRHSFGPGDGEHNPWKHYDAEENKKAYDLSQDQRKQERDIRKQKRKVMALKEAIDACTDPDMKRTLQDAYNAEYDKLGNMNSRYNAFCDENGLPRLADRLQVAEWNYKEAMKAYEAGTSPKNGLTETANSGTISPETGHPPLRSMSNEDVRKWYLAADAKIPDLIDRSRSLEDQARQACDLRNQNRTMARDLMADQETRKRLDQESPNKSFEELLADKMARKHLTREEAIEDILRTATKTNREVNKKFGLEGEQ